VGLEQGPLSLVSTIEELLERKISGFSLEIRECGRRDVTLTTWTIYRQNDTNFAEKLRSLGRYSSLADSGHGVFSYQHQVIHTEILGLFGVLWNRVHCY
jgi:hypothetical protein